jgi:formylglycine-generating enzyme required for sulfatase activity
LADWLHLRENAAQHEGVYGELFKKRLIPELVEHEGLRIGRFPVTWAQISVMDKKWTPEPNTMNYPAIVPYEVARDYCRWLSDLTGRSLQLPTKEQYEKLVESAKPGNTLDRWAGYPVNPDDEERLQRLLGGHAGRLVLPVDAHPSATKARIFDLKGNVAEWVEGDAPGLIGPSADTADDDRARYRPRTQLTGFRIAEKKKED